MVLEELGVDYKCEWLEFSTGAMKAAPCEAEQYGLGRAPLLSRFLRGPLQRMRDTTIDHAQLVGRPES